MVGASRLPRSKALVCAVLLASCLLGAGCGTSVPNDAGPPDAHTDGGDPGDANLAPTTLPGCEGVSGLELGRCELPDGSECTGAADEGGHFVSVTPGSELHVIRGPQGFEMLILAARTQGIDPGDATMPASADNPRVEIHLIDGSGVEQSLYRGRSAFVRESGSPDTFFNAGLFVIVDPTTTGLRGGESRAMGKLTDAAGVTRCGELVLTVAP